MTTVTITSVVELSAAQLEKVKKAVTKKYGKEMKVVAQLDPSLVGGVTITVGSRQFDGSVRSQLEQIHKAMDEKLAS
jgi:F-type H+-transporting ATPase subunit delta